MSPSTILTTTEEIRRQTTISTSSSESSQTSSEILTNEDDKNFETKVPLQLLRSFFLPKPLESHRQHLHQKMMTQQFPQKLQSPFLPQPKLRQLKQSLKKMLR